MLFYIKRDDTLFSEYNACNLCPRECNVNRNKNEKGWCNQTSTLRLARASLHMWEEPPISGIRGSGTVFFTGCSLKCIYCQNYKISSENEGKEITPERLSEIFLELQEKGAHNINLVTADHFAPHICHAIKNAKEMGLTIPVVLNSSGYIKVKTIKMLERYIDIYLVDCKYFLNETAKKYSRAENYCDAAESAIKEMVNQKPKLIFDEYGMLQKGVVIRILCLPHHTEETKEIIKSLYERYGESVCYSIMSQYTPTENTKNIPPLDRKLSQREYDEIVDFCIDLGMENAFVQEGESASESFIPEFDAEGL